MRRRAKPRALDRPTAVVMPAEIDVFDEADDSPTEPPPPTAPKRRSWLGRDLRRALRHPGLAGGRPVDRPADPRAVRARRMAGLAGRRRWRRSPLLALLVILMREMLALARLASVEKLRAQGARRDRARRSEGRAGGRRRTVRLRRRQAGDRGRPARAGRACEDDIIDGADLVRLAETEILAPLDARAKTMILDAAKRVSLVTAVSPRALVDIAYVRVRGGPADPPAVGALWRPAGHARLLPAGARRARPSRRDRRDRRRRRLRPADRRPGPRRAAFGQARRRRRQRHDDGAHRHRRDGDHAAPALHRAEAARHGRFPRRARPPSRSARSRPEDRPDAG